MAPNVFGNPITDETLKGMPEYANKEVITSEDRAQVALNLKENVVKFAEDQLDRTQFPEDVKTFGIIYNATGHTLTKSYNYDWFGNVDESSYPEKIENGECGVFSHIGDYPKDVIGGHKASIAAIVYWANNGLVGGFCKWLLAWCNEWSVHNNKAYTEFQPPQMLEHNWEAVHEKLKKSDEEHTAHTVYGFKATVLIGNGSTPTFSGIITLQLTPPNA